MPARADSSIARLLRDSAQKIHASRAVTPRPRWEARMDAEEILRLAAPHNGAHRDDRLLTSAQQRRFDELLRRRLAGEPLALLEGEVEFRGLRLMVRPGTFAPRLSSEMLAGEAIRRLRGRRAPVAIDVATGVGPVALAIANEVTRARVVGVDISASSVTAARANARRHGLDNVEFKRGDLLDPVPRKLRGHVDVITAHLPYIPRADVRLLPKEIAGYEPLHTLTDGSSDGLGLLRVLAGAAPTWLRQGGWLILEVSPDRVRHVLAVVRPHLGESVVIGGREDTSRVVAFR
jgi:release factor glutamine methyltransferase